MMDLSQYKGKRIAAAVSGGADSAVLLHRLVQMQESCGFSLAVVHCEHGIRGAESLADMAFVDGLCVRYGIGEKFFFSENCVEQAARTGESLETAARNFRYRCFESLLSGGKADFIALAHHIGDQAETVLFRLSRGTALTGAGAMRETSGKYLRPLLKESKQEILRYAKENGLEYREDSTNFALDATRNRLRIEVLPRLCEAVPSAAENIAAFSFAAQEDDDLLFELSKDYLQRIFPEFTEDSGWRVKICEKAPLFKRACLTVLKALGVDRDYTAKHLNALISLCSLQTGAEICLPCGVIARRQHDTVAFLVKAETGGELPPMQLREGGFAYGRYLITASFLPIEGEKVLRLDGEKLPDSAVIRLKRQGDIFEKFGGGKKSLKKYLVDEKIPAGVGAELPILADRDGGEVYAVLGVEIAKKVKVTKETKKTLYLKIERKKE